MNKDTIAGMFFDVVDVIKTLESHSITQDMIDCYDKSQFKSEDSEGNIIYKVVRNLADLPKDSEGTQTTIGMCLHDLEENLLILEKKYEELEKEYEGKNHEDV
jgi:hypothetical protein